MNISDENLLLLSGLHSLYLRKFNPAYQKVDSQDNLLHKNQIRVLMLIGNRGKITSTEIGKCLYLQKSSITTLIDSLIEKKLVTKTADLHDRRKSWITLTDFGEKHRQEKYNSLNEELRNILDKLSDTELIELFNALRKSTEILQKL